MLAPGRRYCGSPIPFTANFKDAAGDDVDPATVTFIVRDPCGTETTYVYATDAELTRQDEGDYTATVTPDRGGRWYYRWQTTGTGTTIATEGDFLVQASPFSAFSDDCFPDYCAC